MTPLFVLIDIEGTTTELAFVHDVLFPISHRAMPDFVRAHWESEEVRAAAEQVGAADPEALTAQLLAWIEADRKEPTLKAIQGKIWRKAYESGEVVSHVYPDVPAALRRWKASSIGVAVFSSGSVEAQQLIFRHSKYGDLTPLLGAGYFDTSTGPKREPDSYAAIAKAMGAQAETVLFLSDVTAELDAARAAGMATRQVVRPGIKDDKESRHPKIRSFDELSF